jgi:hypothetical protein
MVGPNAHQACRKARRISDNRAPAYHKRQLQGTQGRSLGWRLSGCGVCFVGLSSHQGRSALIGQVSLGRVNASTVLQSPESVREDWGE